MKAIKRDRIAGLGRVIMKVSVPIAIILLFAAVLLAHDYIPGEKQSKPILLSGGRLHTVSNGVMDATDILFENGRITQIAKNITPPDGAEVVDITGKDVYPGLIASGTSIGLVEIGAVRATNDTREIGNINPNIQTHVAYNPDSEIIPSVRANGITTVLVIPGGGLIAGRSSLINLDGWTIEDAAEKINVGLHINWPRAAAINAWWMEQSVEEQKKQMTENRKAVFKVFEEAKQYLKARQNNPDTKIDMRMEAMMPVFSGEMPVFIAANDYRQIDQAVAFTKEFGLRMILMGGSDSWMCTELLKENGIPVITGTVHGLPGRQDDPYDIAFTLSAKLAEAGVKFALAQTGGTGTRNLPLQAGRAIANGLSPEEALRAVTLSPAEIFGVDTDLGSLEVGKKATLVVSEGDIFDVITHRVVLEYIEGRKVDLDNKHKELYRKYSKKKIE